MKFLSFNDKENISGSDIISSEDKQIFINLAKYLDSNGRRIKRIINMYMLSKKFITQSHSKLLSLLTSKNLTRLLLLNIIFAEQWPYRLSLIIIYIESINNKEKYDNGYNKLYGQHFNEELLSESIIDIYEKIKDQFYLSKELTMLSMCDSNEYLFSSFIKEYSDIKLSNFYISCKYYIFNLNPAIRLSILNENVKLRFTNSNKIELI